MADKNKKKKIENQCKAIDTKRGKKSIVSVLLNEVSLNKYK